MSDIEIRNAITRIIESRRCGDHGCMGTNGGCGHEKMTRPIVKFVRLRPDAIVPKYMSAAAAGLDLAAALDGPQILQPGQRAAIGTGLSIALPPGYEAQVRPRSGLASKHGLTVVNAPGTIDADYRGEVKVLLVNLGTVPVEVEPGMRIAQMVVAPVCQVELVEVAELDATARGSGGFGSTGKNEAGSAPLAPSRKGAVEKMRCRRNRGTV